MKRLIKSELQCILSIIFLMLGIFAVICIMYFIYGGQFTQLFFVILYAICLTIGMIIMGSIIIIQAQTIGCGEEIEKLLEKELDNAKSVQKLTQNIMDKTIEALNEKIEKYEILIQALREKNKDSRHDDNK